MEEAVVGATIQVLIQNLISVSVNQIKLIRGFKDDLENLRNTLITIQNILYGAEMLQEADATVQQWLKKLEDIAFEAGNVLDEIDYHCLRQHNHKIESKTTIKKRIKSILLDSVFHDNRLKFGHQIRHINKELEVINREANNFGLQTRLASSHGPRVSSSHASETDSFTVDPVFVGRDDDVITIVEVLTNIRHEHVFSILPVVRMGGLGKSTLAREVYRHRKIQAKYGTRMWVHVSANFNPITLFKNILMTLTSEKVEVENREVLLVKLQRALTNKTFLLVLDDVWNQERVKWEGFINSLAGITFTKGNAIIVTTRNTEVASMVVTLPTYELQGLTEENCWLIIKAKAFGGRDVIPSEFESIGRSIVRRCQGLPLAANVVGGILRGKLKDEWLSIQQNWLSKHGKEDVISKVLKLSFDNLPSPWLRKCFAYCSIFSKGESIRREKLIELWMAEGFLLSDQTSDMETIGNKFFHNLLQSSLLQVSERDSCNNVTHCSMHDSVHDVACSVLGQARYIAYINRDELCRILKAKAKYVSILIFNGGIFHVMFTNFKSFHVLTLVSYDVEDLPCSISKIIHLRYFDISYTSIKQLPDTFGELYHLQTFRAHSSSLKKLPSTLKYLIRLRHLHIYGCTELPGELGMLTSLQMIPYFEVKNEKGHRIEELGSLKNLKGELHIYNLDKVKDEEEAKGALLCEKPNIVKLVLEWNESREGYKANFKNVLEGLQPHPNLKSLHIFGFNGTQFPSWTMKMAVQDEGLNNLVDIRLSNCSECEEIPMMGQLPHLKSLHLSDLRNVKFIGSSFYGIDNGRVFGETTVVFPALQRLVLNHMPNMREWVEVELPTSAGNQLVKVFPCLEYLGIQDCKHLRSAPSQFPCLKELDIYRVDSGLPLANICGVKLTSLTRLGIVELDELETLPHHLFHNNENLSQLYIKKCIRLRELPDGLHMLKSLESMSIRGCPSLKSIPCSSSGSSTSLRSLSIENCRELTNLPCEMVESCAPFLECFKLERLTKVINLQKIFDSLHKMPRLKDLAITCAPKYTITSTPTFHGLQELVMGGDDVSWDYISFKEAVGGVLEGVSQSLGRLVLHGREDWESLSLFPLMLISLLSLPVNAHLTSLSSLELVGFGAEELRMVRESAISTPIGIE